MSRFDSENTEHRNLGSASSRNATRMRSSRRSAKNTSDANQGELGLVVTAHGRHFGILNSQGQLLQAHPRGKKSEAVVGDRVYWKVSEDAAVIEGIAPRRNLMHRQDPWRTKSFAANVDQLLIMVAAKPQFSESQLCRALIAAHAANIPAAVLLNKFDLPEFKTALERLAPYQNLTGLRVLTSSLQTQAQAAQDLLWPLLENKHTLVLGPSGTGKSTLVNVFAPQAQAATAEISQALNSGKHTTTYTRLFALETPQHLASSTAAPCEELNEPAAWPRTALLDSPGFQEFGLHHIEPAGLAGHMPDLADYLGTCRFHNCTHHQEPGCAIQQAVASGQISPRRWAIYHDIYQELISGRRLLHQSITS